MLHLVLFYVLQRGRICLHQRCPTSIMVSAYRGNTEKKHFCQTLTAQGNHIFLRKISWEELLRAFPSQPCTVLTRFCSLTPNMHHLLLAKTPQFSFLCGISLSSARSLGQALPKSSVTRAAAWQRVQVWKVRVSLLYVSGDC